MGDNIFSYQEIVKAATRAENMLREFKECRVILQNLAKTEAGGQLLNLADPHPNIVRKLLLFPGDLSPARVARILAKIAGLDADMIPISTSKYAELRKFFKEAKDEHNS